MKTPAFIKVVRIQEVPSARIVSPEEVEKFWRDNIASKPDHDPDKEYLYVLVLDTKHNLKGVNMVSCGSLNESIVHPREVFRPVIAMAGKGFILIHNHPSGDPCPSSADRAITQKIREGSQLLCLDFMDHVIIGTRDEEAYRFTSHFSFRESGLL